MQSATQAIRAENAHLSEFGYLIDKIANAPWLDEPFRHLYLENFLSDEHFAQVVTSKQIALEPARNTSDLLDAIEGHGYKAIPFPGCVTAKDEYLKWFETGSGKKYHGATEAFGIVFRLIDYRDPVLERLDLFLQSDEMKAALTEKFGISPDVEIDAGIQKYLHGYEISPHPDIRRKALTWMLNINPGADSEAEDYHTHYLKLKDQWQFIAEFWRGNTALERDWLPWDWCETVKRQRKNNSIVIFSPSNDTIHAVKAEYDHLRSQRTQLYGNLWYELKKLPKVEYKAFDIASQAVDPSDTIKSKLVEGLKKSPIGDTLRGVKRALISPPKTDSGRKVDF